MEISFIIPHLEALIFASDRPLSKIELCDLLNGALAFLEERAAIDQVESAMEAIREKYASDFYPFEVRETGGGWQFLTKRDYYKTVAQINGDKFLKRLSTAALETLAIIAYKHPITKGEMEAIRGVNCDYTVQKLLEKELIVISGRNEKMPGQPLLYATSRSFMDYFGLNSSEDLPRIKEIIATELSEPTLVNELQLPLENTEEIKEDEAEEG
jgi:segregation and condensation protein B